MAGIWRVWYCYREFLSCRHATMCKGNRLSGPRAYQAFSFAQYSVSNRDLWVLDCSCCSKAPSCLVWPYPKRSTSKSITNQHQILKPLKKRKTRNHTSFSFSSFSFSLYSFCMSLMYLKAKPRLVDGGEISPDSLIFVARYVLKSKRNIKSAF